MGLPGMYPSHINGWRREDQSSRASKISSQPDFADMKKRMGSYIPSAPSSIPSDLRKFSPLRRHNQLMSQSCVANSTTRALENKRIQKAYSEALASGESVEQALVTAQSKHVALSRLALYFLSREEMDPPETEKDEGSIISIAAELLRTFGLSREEQNPADPSDQAFWPFDLNKVFVSPTWKAMREASLHKISAWARIATRGNDRVDDVITNLAMGNTVVFGTTVGDNWMQYDGSGIIAPVNGIVRGRHATVLCGWDPAGYFWDENSWGNDWGQDGFCKLAPEVVSDIDSEDFVVIEGGWEEWSQPAGAGA